MKKIFILLAIIFGYNSMIAQTSTQYLGTTTNLVEVRNHLKVDTRIQFPVPYLVGATSVTSTGTQLNYLNQATGTTGTASSNLVYSASPVFTGSVTIPNTSILGTPASITLTNGTGLPMTSGLTGGNWKTIYTNGSGTIVELALPASGQVLTSNGATSAPSWQTPSSVSSYLKVAAGTISSTPSLIQDAASTSSATAIGTLQLQQRNDGLGVTQDTTKGLRIANYTAAAAGAQQISPALELVGQGWKTNSTAASQTTRWLLDVLPIEGAVVPTSSLRFGSSINNGAILYPMTLGSGTNGNLTLNGGVAINLGATATTFTASSSMDAPTYTNTSTSTLGGGTSNRFNMTGAFSPSSGTAVQNVFTYTGTINQTGGANGITRGLYIAPTLTAAADFRAIDVAAGRSIFAGRVEQGKGADVASANDLTLGADGNYWHITGTTTINGIAIAAWQSGSVIHLKFDGSVTVKNNTAPSAGFVKLMLAGAADFSATALDILTLVYDAVDAVWYEVSRSVN